MDKQVLLQYIDACELIEETEHDISNLQKKKKIIATGNVKGSNPDFPYQEQHFKISGTAYTYEDDVGLRMQKKLLEERKKNADQIKVEVEHWLNTVPPRMQRIVRWKLFEGNTWEQVARKMGKKATADSVRKEFERFLKKN